MLKNLICAMALSALISFGVQHTAQAQDLTISGSATVSYGLMLPHEMEIEARSGVQIEVMATGSGHGIKSLFNGSADMAMISSPLGPVVASRNAQEPGSVNGRELVVHQVGASDVAFIVHPMNPLRTLTAAQLYDILAGKIVNWSEVGGPQMPITLLAEQPGGGVRSAVEHRIAEWGDVLFGEKQLQSVLLVRNAVARTPGGFGIAARSIIDDTVALITTGENLSQPYNIVTRGQPDSRMRAVIEAARVISGWNPQSDGS